MDRRLRTGLSTCAQTLQCWLLQQVGQSLPPWGAPIPCGAVASLSEHGGRRSVADCAYEVVGGPYLREVKDTHQSVGRQKRLIALAGIGFVMRPFGPMPLTEESKLFGAPVDVALSATRPFGALGSL